MNTPPHAVSSHARRRMLGWGGGLLGVALAHPVLAGSGVQRGAAVRALTLAHTHTGEHLDVAYAQGTAYFTPALQQLNHFLRDHYTQAVGLMDPALFDQLHRVHALLGTRIPYQIISGYRDPHTNERLRRQRGGGVAKHSLHMDGRAIDVRLPGVPLVELRDAALSLQAGGVGYYPAEQFVHLDTGRVRRW